jgi:DegV family protein with EDD domain
MRIVTDFGADLHPEEAGRYRITVAPIGILFPEGEVRSDEISPDAFYDRLRAMQPHIPMNSLPPSSELFADTYDDLRRSGEPILSIHISSGLSPTFDYACLAASQIDASIEVVDTLTVSGAQRFQVLAAAQAAAAGWSTGQILDLLERIRSATELLFTVGTLDYLRYGGRIGRVEALAGSMLAMKPLITIDRADGVFHTLDRIQTLRRTLRRMVERLDEVCGANTPLWVTVLHAQFSEQARQLEHLVRTKLQVSRLETIQVSPALGVHTGPQTVGLAALPMTLLEGL